jgi:hypothetical protein
MKTILAVDAKACVSVVQPAKFGIRPTQEKVRKKVSGIEKKCQALHGAHFAKPNGRHLL